MLPTMGLFPIRHLIHFVRRSGTSPSKGARVPSTQTSNTNYHVLPTTSVTPGGPLSTACAIPLRFLSTATAVLFIFTCWLATAGNLYTIYPSSLHTFRNSIDDYDSLRIIVRIREPTIYYGQQRILELQGHGKSGNAIEREIIRPEIIKEEAKEPESRGKSRLWFKAEYTVEIPACEGGYAVENGGACIHRDGKRDVDMKNKSTWVPAIESVRVSFCTGYGDHADEEGRDEWEEEKSWDYVFPPRKGPSGIHTAGEWMFGVDKRPLETWRTVDVPGRTHDTSLRTQMTIPTPGGKPQWQFLLTTAGVYINADAWNIYEEEVAVEVPVEKIQTPKSVFGRYFSDNKPRTEVERVLMWRWKGRYGGCPGEMDGRGVVLEVNGESESAGWVRDGEEEEEEEEEEEGQD